MKRKICLLTMALSLTVCLAACGGPSSEVNPTPSAPNVAPTDSPMPSAPVPSDNIVGRVDDPWAGSDALDDARDVARGAVDGARDATRGVIDGMEEAARGAQGAARGAQDAARDATDAARKAAHDATNGLMEMTGTQTYNNLW